MAVWESVSTLPYSFSQGSAVVLDGDIHILGSYDPNGWGKHYKYSNGSWVSVSTLPYSFYQGSAVVLDGEIHILGGNASTSYRTNHYKYSNGVWTEVSTLPYVFYQGSAVVLDGEIHILGSYNNVGYTSHYKYSNGAWTEVSTLPYSFYQGSAVVLDSEIHILGSYNSSGYTKHCKYSNGAWTEVSDLPYYFYLGFAAVLDGEIDILGGSYSSTSHYKYSNGSWGSVSTLPYSFSKGSAVVLDGEINILGGNSNYTKHYKYYTPINKVVYGDKTLLDLTSDTVAPDKILQGYTAHDKSGGCIIGSLNPPSKTPTSSGTAFSSGLVDMTSGGWACTGKPIPINKIVQCRNRKVYATDDVGSIVLNLKGTYVYLSYSGANVLLTAGSSSITIASPGASYVSTFYISSVHYINRNQALITYRYETNASQLLSRCFIRLITLKSDGTLAQSSQINGSGAPSATLNVEGYLIPMFEAKTSWMLIYTATTISTGAMAIYVSRMYAALSTNTLTIPSSSTWTTVAASNANTLMPENFVSRVSEYGGLFFYDGANSKVELDIWAGYSGGNKNVYAEAAGSVSNFKTFYYSGRGYHCLIHILGKTSDGLLAVRYDSQVYSSSSPTQSVKINISLYYYDPVTCYFEHVKSYTVASQINIINAEFYQMYLLNNGVLYISDGIENFKLYTLTAESMTQIGPNNLSDTVTMIYRDYPETDEIGPLSDPFQGIFIS